jgi:FkbM family methyltransferase
MINLKNNLNGSGIFVQIGAGAGDLDKRANCRDGFTEFIKSLPKNRIKKIILVEPNPINIPLLKECWKNYSEAVIYELCIVPQIYKSSTVELFYCPDDAPHYQVASINKEHVKKHYGNNCIINKFEVQTKTINNFIKEVTAEEIELLSLDIEGIDSDILLEIDFINLNIKFLSFEYIHLGKEEDNVKKYLNNNNFEYIGQGVDHNGFDYLYKKKINQLYPITFSIPKDKIINFIPIKNKLLSDLIPGKLETYIYNNENDYYKEYQSSYFALTTKKGGWDCLRHYEIILNGCIPYFPDIEKCPTNTLYLFPKDLIIQGNMMYEKFKLLSLSNFQNNHISEYNFLLLKLLDYIKNNLTTKNIAKYILEKTNKKIEKILYLSGNTSPDYLRCLTLHGFKELLGNKCHDYPKIKHIYKEENIDYSKLYGKGITYTNLLPQNLHNNDLDSKIEECIKSKYFDLIIYGSYERGMPYYELVNTIYNPNDIILLYGEDVEHSSSFFKNYINKGHYIFVRELL